LLLAIFFSFACPLAGSVLLLLALGLVLAGVADWLQAAKNSAKIIESSKSGRVNFFTRS